MGLLKLFDDAAIQKKDLLTLPQHSSRLNKASESLEYYINNVVNPNKVLLIDNPKTMPMLESIRIVIDALPNYHDLKKNNPLNEIKELLDQLAVKSGDYENKGIVGGYHEISGNGKKLSRLDVAKNRLEHRENVIKQLTSAERKFGSTIDKIMKNWDGLVVTSEVVSSGNLSVDTKASIDELFSDKENTRKALTALYMDIRDKKDLYAKRLGVEGEVSQTMGR